MFSYLISLLWLFIQGSFYDATYTLTLGRTGPDCAGRGICGFTQSSSTQANALLSYNAADSTFAVSLIRSKLTSTDMLKQFGTKNTMSQLPANTLFVMEAAHSLSPAVKDELGIPAAIAHIDTGSYAISQTSSLIIVSFKLH